MARSETWQVTDSPVWETRSPYLVKTVLAQKKEIETQSTQERGRLRHEADKQRKRALQLEQHYKQLQGLHKYQGTEMSAVKAALRKRDMDINELQERLSGLEQTVIQTGTVQLAEKLEVLQGEKQDLQRELAKALDEVQSLQQAAQERDAQHREEEARMRQQEKDLDEQRHDLEQAEHEARKQAAKVDRARQKSEWQAQLSEEILNALLVQRRDAMSSLQKLLSSARLGVADVPRGKESARGRDPEAGIAAIRYQRSGAGMAEDAASDDERCRK